MSCGLRDVAEFERAGRPGVLVASEAFTATADHESERLGHPDLRRVFVAHPVQDRTDDEMREMARRALDEVLAGIVSSPAGPPTG